MLSVNIQSLRKEAHLSQQEVASRVGVTRAAVTQWETGASQPRIGMLYKLAEVFDTTPSRLIDYKRPRLGGICISANASAVFAEGHTQTEGDNVLGNGSVVTKIEVPSSILEAHPRARFITIKASSINPMLPGMVHIVYDPFTVPAPGDLSIVCTGINQYQIRCWQLSETGISIRNSELTTIEYEDTSRHEFPYPLGVVCWYQQATTFK